MNNYPPYQPYRPYSRMPNTSTHNPVLSQYLDVLQKSRTNYSNRTLEYQQPKVSQYPTNLSNVSGELEKKNSIGSPLIVSQKSMIVQQQLKTKLEYQSPKKIETLPYLSETNAITIPLITHMPNLKEELNKRKAYTPVSQSDSSIKFPPKEEERFKNFIIVKKLGIGKYSEVFLAMHKQTGFLVALKVIQKKQIIQENMQAQLAWEIKIQYLLEHPNITRLYTFFQTKTEIVLVLEYCSHGQLNTLQQLQPCRKFPEKEAAQYIQQITFALMYIHNQDVIHRDIKPDNILLSFGQVKLADFSFCVYTPDEDRQTQCGTLIYASPQILEGETYDKKSDIWGLGVLTYELCFGKPPWKENQQELIKTACFMIPYTASRDLRDFIENLVKRLSRDRFTAQQAYNHVWLQRVQQLLPQFILNNEILFN